MFWKEKKVERHKTWGYESLIKKKKSRLEEQIEHGESKKGNWGRKRGRKEGSGLQPLAQGVGVTSEKGQNVVCLWAKKEACSLFQDRKKGHFEGELAWRLGRRVLRMTAWGSQQFSRRLQAELGSREVEGK